MPAFSTRSSDECVKVLSADGTLLHINQAGLDLLEARRQVDLSGRWYPDLWPPECRVRISAAIRDAAAGASTSVEGWCPTFAGNPRWWETTFYPDAIRAGRCQTIIGVSRDISVHRAEALAAHDTTSRVWSLAQCSPEGVIGTSADGRVAFCNPAASAMLGVPSDALAGRRWQSILYDPRPERPAHDDRPLLSAVSGASPTWIAEEQFLGTGGGALEVSCDVYPLSPNARWFGTVVTFRDRRSTRGSARMSLDSELRTLLLELNRL